MTALSPHLRQATPVVAVRGEGVHLYGEDGRRYLDFTRMIPALVIDETAVDDGLQAWATAVEVGTSGASER